MEKQIYMTPKQPFFVTSSRSYEKFILNRFGIVHFSFMFYLEEPSLCDSGRVCGHGVLL